MGIFCMSSPELCARRDQCYYSISIWITQRKWIRWRPWVELRRKMDFMVQSMVMLISIFWWEEQPENVGYHKFVDWEDFQDEFKREFCPVYADSAAINWLESTAYFQKNCSVDEYLDEFQDLITEAGYSDPVRETAGRLSRDLAGDPKHIYKYKIRQESAPSRGS